MATGRGSLLSTEVLIAPTISAPVDRGPPKRNPFHHEPWQSFALQGELVTPVISLHGTFAVLITPARPLSPASRTLAAVCPAGGLPRPGHLLLQHLVYVAVERHNVHADRVLQ